MRLEESRKYREQIDLWVTEQEKKYIAKLDKLKLREQDLNEMLQKREMVRGYSLW